MSGRHNNPPRRLRAGRGNSGDQPLGEVYIEHQRIGQQVKVSAIHAETGLEVSIVGPASASNTQLETTAINKLKYVMAKRSG